MSDDLALHIFCGSIQGTMTVPQPGGSIVRWQPCRCDKTAMKWPYCDVSRLQDLCTLCAQAIAGGVSRYSWKACDLCRDYNNSLGPVYGRAPLPLGRHSIMNGRSFSITLAGEQLPLAMGSMLGMIDLWLALDKWVPIQVHKKAAAQGWDINDRVGLDDWLSANPASPQASATAFSEFFEHMSEL